MRATDRALRASRKNRSSWRGLAMSRRRRRQGSSRLMLDRSHIPSVAGSGAGKYSFLALGTRVFVTSALFMLLAGLASRWPVLLLLLPVGVVVVAFWSLFGFARPEGPTKLF